MGFSLYLVFSALAAVVSLLIVLSALILWGALYAGTLVLAAAAAPGVSARYSDRR